MRVLRSTLPLELVGELSTALQFAYLALLTAWNKLTKTDISRIMLRDLINAEREKRGRAPITDLRTITWYFTIFKRLGVIDRERKPGNIWETTSTKPVRSALPADMPKPEAEPTVHRPTEKSTP